MWRNRYAHYECDTSGGHLLLYLAVVLQSRKRMRSLSAKEDPEVVDAQLEHFVQSAVAGVRRCSLKLSNSMPETDAIIRNLT